MLPALFDSPPLVKILGRIADSCGKREKKRRSYAHFGFYPYLAARASHNFFAGGQSQAATGLFFGTALQRKENSLFPFVFDANSVIFNGKHAAITIAPPCNPYFGPNAGAAVLDRISQEILKELSECLRLNRNRRQGFVSNGGVRHDDIAAQIFEGNGY